MATSLGALAVALALALGPFAAVLGFAPLPGMLLAALLGLVVLYLAAAEALKRVAVPRAARSQDWEGKSISSPNLSFAFCELGTRRAGCETHRNR